MCEYAAEIVPVWKQSLGWGVLAADYALLVVAHRKDRFRWPAAFIAALGIVAVAIEIDERAVLAFLVPFVGFLVLRRWKHAAFFFAALFLTFLNFYLRMDC